MNSTEHNQKELGSEIDFITLWRVLWSYKYVIILITGLFAGVAVILALTTTPVYQAEVIIAEAGDSGNTGAAGALTKQLGGLAGLAGIDLGFKNGNANSLAILRSRRLAEEFIERNKLLPTLYARANRPPTLWHAVKDFRESVLSFREEKRNNTTAVTINWTDPKIAASWANQFVALANDVIRTRAMEDSQRNIDYLSGQIARTPVVELQKVMYNLIENETKTLMLASGRAEYAFTVVDPAVAPELRIRPQRTLMVVVGAVMGLLFGIVVAFVVHNVRSRRLRGAQIPA